MHRCGTAGLVCKLLLQLKTHKEPGSVKARNVHATVRHPFAPLGKFLSMKLRTYLNHKNHLVKDSKDLLRKLQHYRFPEGSVLMSADIADFFMTGDHMYLSKHASGPFDNADERKLYQDVILFLCYHQYIGSDTINAAGRRRVWHVICGSGMGCNFSSEVSDTAFYFGGERRFVLNQAIRKRFHVLAYFRFRDDILAVVQRVDGSTVKFVEAWRSHLRITECAWKLEKWQISSVGLNFLDVNLFFDNGRLQSRPYIKATSLGIPLSEGSAHQSSVHCAWPKAMLKRYATLSSHRHYYEVAKAMLMTRLCKYGASLKLLIDIDQYNPYKKSSSSSRVDARNVMWWSMPWHPTWQNASFNKCISDCCEQPRIRNFLTTVNMEPVTMRVAWSLSGKHLFSVLRLIQND